MRARTARPHPIPNFLQNSSSSKQISPGHSTGLICDHSAMTLICVQELEPEPKEMKALELPDVPFNGESIEEELRRVFLRKLASPSHGV